MRHWCPYHLESFWITKKKAVKVVYLCVDDDKFLKFAMFRVHERHLWLLHLKNGKTMAVGTVKSLLAIKDWF